MTQQERDTYVRPVFYYETDRMGVVHHSNYIRWLEEARLACMRNYGVDYTEFEAQGVLMPVVDVACEYRRPAVFGDTVDVRTHLVKYSGVRAVYAYTICLHGTDEVLASAKSTHCFIDETSRKPVNLRRRLPEIDAAVRRIPMPGSGKGAQEG